MSICKIKDTENTVLANCVAIRTQAIMTQKTHPLVQTLCSV